MKKLLMLFFICLFTSSLFAQVKYAEVYKKQLRGVSDPKLIEGNLDFLKSEKNIKIFFDFSQADINGASVKQLIDALPEMSEALDKEEKGWDRKSLNNDVLRYKFIDGLNSSLSGHKSHLRAVNTLESEYKGTLVIIKVHPKGGTLAVIDFSPIDSDTSLAKLAFYYSGGSHGSISNLIGDALWDAGENVGDLLARKAK